jgi:hypothetical protein
MPETEGHGRKIKQEKLLSALRGGNTRRAACAYAGVHWDSLYEWLKDPTFSDAVDEAEAAPEVTCASSVITSAKKDWRAAIAWLERRRHADWKEVKNLDVTTKGESIKQVGYSPGDLGPAVGEADGSSTP